MIRLDWIDSIYPIRWPRLPLIRWIDTLLDIIERSQQRRALTRLDDHLLKDIGLTRTDATEEAKKPGWVP